MVEDWLALDLPGQSAAEADAQQVDAGMGVLIALVPPCQRLARLSATDLPHQLLGCHGEVWHQPLRQGRVHPWSLLDDHSRFALALSACPNQQRTTVQAALTAVFRHYGLPQAILCDNGSPWGAAGLGGLTRLEAWLLRLGVEPWHGRPYHPQTQGKIERFHGTIAREVFARQRPTTLTEAQVRFNAFRTTYNHQRPHEALVNLVPASAYQPSLRPFPEIVPSVVYDDGELAVTVTVHGSISWRGRRRFISRGLVGEPVALRPTADPAVWSVVYGEHQVTTIDLRSPEEV